MVRYKPLPTPRPLDELRRIHESVPADPTATEDCCSYLEATASLPDRETAREWLGFLEALELVDDDGGYYRREWPPDEDELGARFERRILGAGELLEAVDAAGPMTLEELHAALDDTQAVHPRATDGAPATRTRIERLLDWSLQFGLVSKRSDGYVRSETNSAG